MLGKVTVFTSQTPPQLGKVFTPSANRLFTKKVAGHMVEGAFGVKTFDGKASFAELLRSIGTNQALSNSLPRTGALSGKITTRQRPEPDAVPRTKDAFHFMAVPGVLTLDYDPVHSNDPLTMEALFSKLSLICPAVENVGIVHWSSGSSFIYSDMGLLQGLQGQRLYVLVQDASDIERAGEVLAARCWLHGLGRIDISSSGQRLYRSLWDEAMYQPARLDFIGGAVCTPPLYQNRGLPTLLGGDAWMDTRIALPDLTKAEKEQLEHLQKAAHDAAEPAAREARTRWAEGRVQTEAARLQREKKVSAPVARELAYRLVDAALHKTLQGNFQIPLPDGNFITVAEVLASKDAWHRSKTLDPLEPGHRNGEACGMLFLKGSTPTLYSFAHGGVVYELAHQPARVVRVKGRQSEAADELARALMANGDIYLSGKELVQALPGSFKQLDTTAAVLYLLGFRARLVTVKDGHDIAMDIPKELVALTEAAIGQKPDQTPPTLVSITSLPYATADKTLVLEPGYQVATGIYNTMPGDALVVPDNVTREDCIAALQTLWAPWAGYKWATPADRAGMLAAIFMAVLRPAMRTAPAMFFDAPVQASGKTKAALALGALMSGHLMGASTFVDSRNQEDEYSKAIIALLRGGRRFWLLDNVVGRFESPTLAGLITSGQIYGRILGASRDAELQGRVLLCATGNNATLGPDLHRRFLCCRIDTGVEKPSEIAHAWEPAELALKTRMDIAKAVLTLLKAYWAGGGVTVVGGSDFHEWSALIREPVVWIDQQGLATEAGLGPVADPQQALGGGDAGVDPATVGLGQVLTGLHAKFGVGAKFLGSDVFKLYKDGEYRQQGPEGLIRQGLESMANGSIADARRLGQVLSYRKGRRVGGFHLAHAGNSRNGVQWEIQT